MADKTKTKSEEKKTEEVKVAEATKKEDKKKAVEEAKPEKKEKKKVKTEAVANSYNAHLSTKTSAAVCKFIVGKTIDQATNDLREVAAGKKPVPMKGEIPHRHGKIMSGRFPKKASEHFIILLKALAGNVNVNGLEDPIIAEAVANIGSRPFGKFGAVRKKRTHIRIVARSRNKTKFRGK